MMTEKQIIALFISGGFVVGCFLIATAIEHVAGLWYSIQERRLERERRPGPP